MTIDARWLTKLEAVATAFRLVVTVAAAVLAVAILAGVTAKYAVLAPAFLLVIAIAGPLVHGGLAMMLREGRDRALEAVLIGTGALWLLDIAAALAVHMQGVVDEGAWAYWSIFVLISAFHVAAIAAGAVLYARRQAEETTEPEGEPGGELA